MIRVSENVQEFLNQYENYLVGEYDNSRANAKKKSKNLYNAIKYNLSGMIGHRYSTYKKLGSDKGYQYFTYKDKKSGTNWAFAFEDFGNNNYYIHIMTLWKFVSENKEIQKSLDFMWRLLKVS